VQITNIGGGINNFGVGNSITATVVDTSMHKPNPAFISLAVLLIFLLVG
jgi:hypothetical protein